MKKSVLKLIKDVANCQEVSQDIPWEATYQAGYWDGQIAFAKQLLELQEKPEKNPGEKVS